MKFPLPAFLRSLSGSSSRALFVGYLVGHLDSTIAGATLCRRTLAGEVGRAEAVELIRVIEHEGDGFRNALIVELHTSLITPFDRADLFRLSGAIDDILDNLRDFLREWSLFEMESSPVIEPVIDSLCAALPEFRAAIASLGQDPRSVSQRAQAAKKAGVAIRRTYEYQLAELFRGEFSMRTFKERDLLRQLDIVGLRLRTAADILSDASVKHADF